MTREQYEAAKAAITADYIKEKSDIIAAYEKEQEEIDRRYRTAQEEYRAAGQNIYQTSRETRAWFDQELAALKARVRMEESGSEGPEVMRIRQRHSLRVEKLTEEKHKRLNANDHISTLARIAYTKATEGWLINTRDRELRLYHAKNEAKALMYERLAQLPRYDETEEGGAE